MTMMRALVLEKQHELKLREIDLPMDVGPGMVKIKLHTVGVCGSDVHYYTHGKIGPFVVNEPMVLGHEAAGTITEVGARVCRRISADSSRARTVAALRRDAASRLTSRSTASRRKARTDCTVPSSRTGTKASARATPNRTRIVCRAPAPSTWANN